jgi:hypothetical protein
MLLFLACLSAVVFVVSTAAVTLLKPDECSAWTSPMWILSLSYLIWWAVR